MKLSEKILYCRKKEGLSQEALADMIGVSRQAISKWETGEAAPEVRKLYLLAKVLGVTTDWLLSEDKPEPEPKEKAIEHEDSTQYQANTVYGNSTWVDSLPNVISRLIRRYGWLYGVYVAISGLSMIIVGMLARGIMGKMVSSDPFGLGNNNEDFFGGGLLGNETIWYDELGNVISSPFGEQASSIAMNNPVAMLGTAIMGIGIVVMVAGIILAVYLKKLENKA